MTTIGFEESFGNVSFTTLRLEIEKAPIISDRTKFYLRIVLDFILFGGFSLFGTINNVFNVVVFHRIGLKDSMGVGLMAQSLTDLCVCFLGILRMIYFVWNTLVPDSKIYPLALSGVTAGWPRDILFLCSSWITAFISLERCVCVVFPFKVKQIFTKFRSIVAIVVIYFVVIAIHLPVFLTQSLGWTKVEVNTPNGTVLRDRFVIKYTSSRPKVMLYIDISNGTVLPVPCQIVIMLSVVWLIYGLKMSSQVRGNNPAKEKEDSEKKPDSKLTGKERRLVKVVLFLAIISSVCNIPRFFAVYSKQIFPSIANNQRDKNVFYLLWSTAFLFSGINASLNFVVYLLVNKTYKQKFKEILCCKNV